jgi:hypothetical protein
MIFGRAQAMAGSHLNPYSPGAGHSPPYLAGREHEAAAFREYLQQTEILKNVILTGLRGTGKTVLMDDRFKPIAQQEGWVWIGSDFAESSFLSETNLCLRLLTDMAVFTSSLSVPADDGTLGFDAPRKNKQLSFDFLATYLQSQPGLMVDKLKATLEFVWTVASTRGVKGVVFAYDEAQVVRDREDKEQYPLALLLETFQSIQRRGVRFLLLLTGLPTLFPKLVESRTYAERMFAVLEIGRLSPQASCDAIEVPLKKSPWQFTKEGVKSIVEVSDGYPYFIQFICRETFDHLLAKPHDLTIPIDAIVRKLDSDFFAGRWEKVTDRQRELLHCIAQLPHADEEFTISEIVDISETQPGIKRFGYNDVSQALPRLIDKGLLYKNRHGKYCFAVPLFSSFIRRRFHTSHNQKQLFG